MSYTKYALLGVLGLLAVAAVPREASAGERYGEVSVSVGFGRSYGYGGYGGSYRYSRYDSCGDRYYRPTYYAPRYDHYYRPAYKVIEPKPYIPKYYHAPRYYPSRSYCTPYRGYSHFSFGFTRGW